MPDQPKDNALYLRKWAEDIRAHNGKSVDADRLDAIAGEIERLRGSLERARHHWVEAAEAALQGDLRPLRLRIDMAKEPMTDDAFQEQQ